MNKIEKFKRGLAVVFDDSLHTKKWHNIIDYTIIGLIIISTLEVFLSTYTGIVERYGRWLNFVDYFTTIFFTVEVSLRIWCADLLDEKYKGFKGRLRYCFSFYGFIDIISTFPFYLHFFMKIPYVALKALRIARLLRVFRYMKAFKILSKALQSKKDEMMVSLQFLAIVTLILSFILFFVENEAQPEVYNNGWKSVVWSFAQYIGDPGNFADTPPITFTGRVIACVIGILGIAIFAVPAGLIGSGFSDAMEDENKKTQIKENVEKLYLAFETKLDRPTGFQIVPQHRSICDIQARLGLKSDEVFDAVEASKNFRIINLAATQTIDEHPQDKLAIEHFVINRPYGYCIDRGSKITIVSPTSYIEPAIGNFSFYLAQIGGFNYISREIGVKVPFCSYLTFEDKYTKEENLAAFMEDLEKLTSREGAWTLSPLVASGANEPAYPTIFHFSAGGKKGDESFEGDNLFVKDMAKYRAIYEDLSSTFESELGMKSDHQRYHNCSNPNWFTRRFEEGRGTENNIVLRIAWSACLWDPRRIKIAKVIADKLNQHICGAVPTDYDTELYKKRTGY